MQNIDEILKSLIRKHSSLTVGKGDIHGNQPGYIIYENEIKFIVAGLKKHLQAEAFAQDAGACEHCDFVAWRWRWGEKDFWKYTDLNGPGIPSTAYQVEPLYTDRGSSLRTPAESDKQ